MKSNLLSKYDLSREESFKKDIEVLLALPDESLKQIPGFALLASTSVTAPDIRKAYDNAAETLRMPRLTLGHALDVCQFFLRHFGSDGEAELDEPEDIASDLFEAFHLPPERTEAFVHLLASLKAIAQDESGSIAAVRAQTRNILPNVTTFLASAELRAVFAKEYDAEVDVDDYAPRCIGAVPVGIVKLRLSSGVPNEVYFQITPQFLETVIAGLRALEKELDTVSQRFDVGIKE